jgi:hypothetical protein
MTDAETTGAIRYSGKTRKEAKVSHLLALLSISRKIRPL